MGNDALKLTGWVDAWTSPYSQTEFTTERRALLVECIRYRHYNFTYESHQTVSFAAPFYSDNKLCVLTKAQWDSVLSEAYAGRPIGRRLMPQDIIKTPAVDQVLYEPNKRKEN